MSDELIIGYAVAVGDEYLREWHMRGDGAIGIAGTSYPGEAPLLLASERQAEALRTLVEALTEGPQAVTVVAVTEALAVRRSWHWPDSRLLQWRWWRRRQSSA